MEKQITRKAYLDGKISHQEYYETLADIAGISFGETFLRMVKTCLESGDENLNAIPLQTWDKLCNRDLNKSSLNSELKKRGDNWSLSCGVCMRKAKAKAMAQKLFGMV